MNCRLARTLSTAAAAVLLGSPAVHAQASVVGVVRDSAGTPIMSAEVTLLGRRVLTDSLGRFFMSHAPADSIVLSVRRLGYESVTFTLTRQEAADNSVDVVMRRLATTLETVDVTGMSERAITSLRGFDERRQVGMGTYLTRADIEKRNSNHLADVLRQQRGVVVSRTRFGQPVVRFGMHQAKRCQPLIWLDGQAAPGLEVNQVHPNDVEGIELYMTRATTPGEFHRGSGADCGTIVIWTKRPRLDVRPKPKPE